MEKIRSLISYLHDCPHCREPIVITVGVIAPELKPLYQGPCCDCRYCLPWEYDEDWVAYCAYQGNVNPILFTRESLDARVTRRAESAGEFEGYPHCLAFWPKDMRPPAAEDFTLCIRVEEARLSGS